MQHRGSRYVRPSAVDSILPGWLIPDQLRNEPIRYQKKRRHYSNDNTVRPRDENETYE